MFYNMVIVPYRAFLTHLPHASTSSIFSLHYDLSKQQYLRGARDRKREGEHLTILPHTHSLSLESIKFEEVIRFDSFIIAFCLNERSDASNFLLLRQRLYWIQVSNDNLKGILKAVPIVRPLFDGTFGCH